MHASKFRRGQTVAMVIRIGQDMEKRRLGEVIDVGARAARHVADAERDVARADEQVSAARLLLTDAERDAIVARDRLRAALASKAELERRTGGAR